MQCAARSSSRSADSKRCYPPAALQPFGSSQRHRHPQRMPLSDAGTHKNPSGDALNPCGVYLEAGNFGGIAHPRSPPLRRRTPELKENPAVYDKLQSPGPPTHDVDAMVVDDDLGRCRGVGRVPRQSRPFLPIRKRWLAGPEDSDRRESREGCSLGFAHAGPHRPRVRRTPRPAGGW